jgi:hypothetical protein
VQQQRKARQVYGFLPLLRGLRVPLHLHIRRTLAL